MKGIIKKVEPNIYQDEHRSWKSKYGTIFYEFNVEIQVDDKVYTGTANGKNTTASYNVGDEVEFEYQESNNNFPSKFKGIKKEGYNDYKGGGGSTKRGNDFYLAQKIGMCKSTGSKLAVMATLNIGAELTFENIVKIVQAFQNWLLYSPDDMKEMSRRMSALSRAVESMELKGFDIKTSAEILELAERWLKEVQFD